MVRLYALQQCDKCSVVPRGSPGWFHNGFQSYDKAYRLFGDDPHRYVHRFFPYFLFFHTWLILIIFKVDSTNPIGRLTQLAGYQRKFTGHSIILVHTVWNHFYTTTYEDFWEVFNPTHIFQNQNKRINKMRE